MASAEQNERETHRIIVLGRGGTEVLLVPTGERFVLPPVEIPRWQRVVENLSEAFRTEWAEEVICLFEPRVFSGKDSGGIPYQAAEHWRSVGTPRTPTRWVPVSNLSNDLFPSHFDWLAIQRSVAQCHAEPDGPCCSGPFARLGWFKELREWVELVIEPAHLHLGEKFLQLNGSASFSLLRFETNGVAVWFKAVGKPNLREFPITVTLSKLFPQRVAPILATRPDLNGWLALEIEATRLEEAKAPEHWCRAASALAELQLESIRNTETLIAHGAQDLRMSRLLKRVRPFLDTMAQLMDMQAKVPPPILCRKELVSLGEHIEEALACAIDLGLPDSLGHLDLNPENILVSEKRCVFLDWAEACVGYPFLSFQYLLETFRRMIGRNAKIESWLTTTYTGKWNSLVSSEKIAKSLALAPLLAVFAHAAGSEVWSDEARLRDYDTGSYLRSLTRRMNREAQALAQRKIACVYR